MIQFEKFTLDNGLRVILHKDESTPIVALNILYDVGAKDEDEHKTGFAHLFEHLMFGGSVNIPDYDDPLQNAGGENNAYTTNDLTNYYLSLPKENLETAMWLESDRMLSLAFSKKSLDVQRKVVCEEFKEHYLNKPYGDIWHLFRPLIYKVHPYKWMTIGKELKHVEDATLQDVKDFFAKHYNPSNAIMCIAGNITKAEVMPLIEKYFGSIPSGTKYVRNLPVEPAQNEPRHLSVHADVPTSALYKAYHIAARMQPGYHEADLITEVLSGGQSSRLYQQLVKEKQLCTSIDCYHMGSVEQGIIIIDAKIDAKTTIEIVDAEIEKLLETFLKDGLDANEIEKAKNKTESLIAFEDLSLVNRANNLAFYELLGDANLMNKEIEQYKEVTANSMMTYANKVFDKNNCSTMYYNAIQKSTVS
jgi:zinc protease